jgi:hypothetical protein
VRAAGARLLLVLVVVSSVGGCASETTATTEVPTCSDGVQGVAANGVLLMAQSVPTASWVPCLRTGLPLGWGVHHLDARDGVARFWLDSDRDGDKAIEVRLEKSCDTTGTTEIPSDRDGMRRLERVTLTSPHFEGERYYLFEGGCITVVFQLDGDSPGEPLALATQAVGTASRADLAAQVHEDSGGRLSLDPPTDEEK